MTESSIKEETPIISSVEFPLRDRIIERLFHPSEQTDQFEFKRRVYKYNGLTFSFRGREELPIVPIIQEAESILLGSTPIRISPKDFGNYTEEVQGKNYDVKEARHFIATKDIHGVIALAQLLNPDDGLLISSVNEIKDGIYSSKVLEIIDSLIACNWISEVDTTWKSEIGKSGADAEAVVIASLLGDEEAVEYVKQQKQKLSILDKIREGRRIADLEPQWQYLERFPAPKISDLVGVHATKYRPRETNDGFEIPTTGEATNWTYLRNTCHISLNHKVRSHLGGNWNLTPFTIIAPFELMLQANGNPTAIDELDTWWVRNPGETLKFPNASLVEPGTPPEGQLFVIGNHKTIFKGESYTLDDLTKVENTRGWGGLWEDFQDVLMPYESEETEWTDWNFKGLSEVFISKYFSGDEEVKEFARDRGRGGPQHAVFETLFMNGERGILVRNQVLKLLEDANLTVFFRKEPSRFHETLELLANKIAGNIEGRLFNDINEMALRQTIKLRGFPTAENLRGQSNSLGKTLKSSTSSTDHFYSPESSIVNGHLSSVNDALVETQGGEKRFEWPKYIFNYNLQALDEKTRRVLYVAGVTNARM